MKLGLEFAQNLANERSEMCLSSSYHNRRTSLLHFLEDVLKVIHSLLELIVFKEGLGAHTVYVKMQDLVSNMLKS